jgi:hypothetical protein
VPATVDPERRLSFIDQRLAEGVAAARLHTFGWAALQSLSLAGNAALLFVVDEEARPDRAVAAATSAAGVIATFVNYPAILRDQPRVAELASPSHPRSTLCFRLALAERILVADAEHEARTRSWLRHALNLGFNAAMGLVLGLGFGRWTSAAIGSGGSAVVGEIILFTRSTAATDALEAYRSGGVQAHGGATFTF